jgi:hypothetical protein
MDSSANKGTDYEIKCKKTMNRAKNEIKKFIDELPPEFDAIRHKAEKLLDAHRDDVIAAYVHAGIGTLDTDALYESAEAYYEKRHTTL